MNILVRIFHHDYRLEDGGFDPKTSILVYGQTVPIQDGKLEDVLARAVNECGLTTGDVVVVNDVAYSLEERDWLPLNEIDFRRSVRRGFNILSTSASEVK